VAVDGGYQVWRERLPGLVASLEEEWDLRTGEPFTGGIGGWTAPATTADGDEVVLKVSFPHREAREEARALALWCGRGAVRLLRSDRERWALLLERCRPGTRLADAELPADEALPVAAASLVGLRSMQPTAEEAATFERVADVCAEWAIGVRQRMDELGPPFDPGLVALGASLLEELPASAGREVLVHGDFNPGNVLAAEREPWLTIDPKPMVGDPAYDPPPMVLQIEPEPTTVAALRERALRFGDLVGEPVDRLLAWTVARCVEAALWSASHGAVDDGLGEMVVARLAADAAGL